MSDRNLHTFQEGLQVLLDKATSRKGAVSSDSLTRLGLTTEEADLVLVSLSVDSRYKLRNHYYHDHPLCTIGVAWISDFETVPEWPIVCGHCGQDIADGSLGSELNLWVV